MVKRLGGCTKLSPTKGRLIQKHNKSTGSKKGRGEAIRDTTIILVVLMINTKRGNANGKSSKPPVSSNSSTLTIKAIRQL
jgi:hypothetical protein